MATITPPNPHLAELKTDHFYHIGFNTGQDLKKMFGDVRFVLFGGTNTRMKKVAQAVADAFFPLPLGHELTPIGTTDRYHMYKVGQVIAVSHQMGMPSFSILLHEMTKLLAAAQAKDVIYMRIGTSGGVGLPGGSIVVTDLPVNGYLEPYYELVSLGKLHKRPAELDKEVRETILSLKGDLNVVAGHTMSVDCFFEGQGRLDGAICDYSEKDKFDFLKRAAEAGVRNIEMESVMFGAFCKSAGVRGAVICTTLLNRLEGDQVTMTPQDYENWMKNVITLTLRLIGKTLDLSYDK